MSMFYKAKGTTPSVGLLLIRLTLGIYVLSLGIMQTSHIEGYVNQIKAMNILSDNTAFIIGFVGPFLLIIFGAMYIMGFFTPVSSFALAVITFAKILAHGFFPGAGMPFNKDVIILMCFILTMFAGAGMISFDALLDRKKKPPVAKPEQKTLPPENKQIENKNIVTAEIISETKTDTPPGNK
jgi:uncharacterized membrane protein YphA (DoxX/SURF4 family)